MTSFVIIIISVNFQLKQFSAKFLPLTVSSLVIPSSYVYSLAQNLYTKGTLSLADPMRECKGQHSCRSARFSIAKSLIQLYEGELSKVQNNGFYFEQRVHMRWVCSIGDMREVSLNRSKGPISTGVQTCFVKG